MRLTGRPITKKNNRSFVRGNRGGFTIASPRYRQYEEDCLWQLKQYKEKHTGPMSIKIVFEMKGKLDSDLDNMVTSILDVLQKAEVIDDDKNVMALDAQKYRGFKDWVTHIEIKKQQR
jgi:crossover junction endodeoxyribonuclease RusA